MTPERWHEIENLLQGALECAPAERATLLDHKCAGDPDLRAEVESLLSSAHKADGFLTATAAADAAVLLADEQWDDTLLGGHVGPYSIKKQLGVGGMGEVFLAHDARLDRTVALKLLNPVLTGDSATRTRFLREARLASALDHPNVCTIHEVGEAAGRLFIAMQYVEGDTLRRIIDGRPLSLDSLLSISLQVANALSVAHSQGIIHRDVKPGNIIITSRGQAKVLDFGLAKLLDQEEADPDTHLTMAGVVMGTPSSMSPEQARGERVDHRSDVFSFGVVLYEMATGQVPFSGRSKADVISALLTQSPIPARELNPEIPASLASVIDRALAKDPDQRYQTMDELIAGLRQVVSEVGGLDRLFNSLDIPHGVVPLVRPSRDGHQGAVGPQVRNRVAAIVVVIAVVLVAVAVVLYYTKRAQPPPAGSAIKSIAVLPFKPLLAENRDEALELGMADTLINKLSSIKQVTVRPLSAVRKYTSLEQDAAAAGREQRVDAVLDGNIQRSGQKLRVTVRLVRVADGQEMWTEQFDEQFTDIFSVQDSVSSKVSGVLAVTLTGEEKELLTKRQTADIEAYQLYLMGRYHLNRLTDEGLRKALDYFQRAIDKDPSYALAYAGLADAYISLGDFDALPPRETFPKANQAASQALKLDQNLAEAHVAQAQVKFLYEWDWKGSEEEYLRAIAINPGYSEAHQMYGYFLSGRSQFDEALKEMQRAQELDPLSLAKIAGVGEVLHLARRDDEAIVSFQKVLEMDPNFGFAHWALGRAYAEKGMYEQAIASFQKAIQLSGDSPDEPAELGRTLARSGRKAEALKIANDLKEQSKRKYISPCVIATLYAALGEKDQAFEWLDKAYEARDFILVLLKVEPMFDNLRSDPRFTVLLKRVGLEP